jgi:CIC family chloride channel protein
MESNTHEDNPEPSYMAYSTRAPVIGQGRILLPVINPETATFLFQLAGGIATVENLEIECLNVIKVPKHSNPSQTPVITQPGRQLLHRLERSGRHQKLPVHTQIRIAHDTAQAILETIRDRHINLLILEWKGYTSTPGAVFGGIVDILIRKAPCEVMIVKWGTRQGYYPQKLDKDATWLVPMAGGPNAQRAIKLLPGLSSLYTNPRSPIIWLCKVYEPSSTLPDYQGLEHTAQSLKQQLDRPVIPLPIRSGSVSEAIIHLAKAETCDVVILGVSREGLLEQVLHGNIPKMIAKQIESTVILVRGALDV